MKQVIVIPARMKGTRLPGKPLINILQKPMIQHVWEKCEQVISKDYIYVATEDDEIKDFCENNNVKLVLSLVLPKQQLIELNCSAIRLKLIPI